MPRLAFGICEPFSFCLSFQKNHLHGISRIDFHLVMTKYTKKYTKIYSHFRNTVPHLVDTMAFGLHRDHPPV